MALRWPEPHEHVKKLTTDTVWTASHPQLSTLELLRDCGDDIADDVILHWREQPNGSVFEAFHTAFVDNADDVPKAYARLRTATTTVPCWVDWNLVAQGQAVFWRYCIPILQARVLLVVDGWSIHNDAS